MISIQNASKTLKKIRIIGVNEKHKQLFTIHTLNTYQNLAAGCSIDIPITFLCKQALSHSIYTELRIAIKDRMIDGQFNIETIVKIPSSNIDFKSLLDFNTIITKQTISKPFLVTNNGQKKGFYKFEIPKQYQSLISIKPDICGELDINQAINLEIQLIAPDKLGIFRCSINIIIDNDENNIKTLEIICNICQHKINFLMPKTKTNIEQINFGHLYFGQKRSFKGLLINNGPKSAHYSLYLKPNKNKDNISNTHYKHKDTSKSEKSENINDIEINKKQNYNNNNDDDDDEFDEDLQPINIDYEEGTLGAYESKLITISYIPKIRNKFKGFSTNYNPQNDINEMRLLLVIQSKEIIKIALSGISFPVMYNLSQKSFDFGECPVYDRRDLYFELKNENKLMSLPYKFNKIACFNANPSSGTLLPLQSINILLTFLPKQLGIFNHVTMQLIFNNNETSGVNLLMNGASNQYNTMKYKREKKYKTRNHFGTKLVGGINKLPIDFKPNIKIINESNVNKEISAIIKDKTNINFATELPNEKSVYYRADWNTSTCIKGLYPNGSQENISIIDASSVDNIHPNLNYTYSNKDRLQRYSNSRSANNYLIYMRKKRKYFAKTKNKNNISNNVCEAKENEEPLTNIERDVVNIGLNNFYGLNEPNLDLPQHNNNNNKLYLGDGQIINTMSDRLTFFKKCMITKYNKKTSINSKIDENKLIRNKFKAIAETSAEIIDCQTTLTRKELKQLKYGPNILDFGKICIHSETRKNFSIVNTLKKTILVEVKLSSENMKIIDANPLSQVIPSQHMAGFDIIFSAKRIGIFEDNIILLINGIHTISFKINAEIISMDLNLSSNKLLFEFPVIDYLDFNLVKSITLSNVLSAETTYKFDTNALQSKEIIIKPCSGIIKPNKSENIQFIWSPKTLRPNKAKETEHIKLHISDGFDKLIEIESILPFAKCTLSNKAINFGVIAIGTEHTKKVQIKNSGHIQTIFRIIRCPTNLSIHPLSGKVETGTSITLSVTYLSLQTQSFDENIIIEVRGGKTLKLSVYAQTIIPQVALAQNEFNFNGVTIGDTKSLPIEIVNTSAVPAHLFLELTANNLYPNGTFNISFPNEWSDLATEPSKAGIISLPSIEEDELHTFMPIQTHMTCTKSSTQSQSRRTSRKASRRSLNNIKSSDCNNIWVVRSLDNPNLLNNNNNNNNSKRNSSASLAINKTKLDTTFAASKSKSKKVLSSPMMRRGSLLAMGQHLTMMKDLEESELSSQKNKEKNNIGNSSDSDAKQELRYRILIDANCTLKFKLTFNPTEINQYDFDLNLTMAGIPFDDQHNLLLRKCVLGNGLKPRIALSTRNISFFDVTVLSEHKAKQQPYEKYIIITNEEDNKIEWQFKMKDNMHHSYSNSMNNLPWKIVPDCGILEPLKTAKIGIYFSPITDELFHDNVDLLLSSSNEVYLSIGLEGQASFPKLSFNTAFVLLPSVPLSCRSSKLLMIKNHGYENLEIRYEIIDDKAAPFINLRFPNGRIIGGNGPNELNVEISLLSAANISFTTRIDFLDIDSNRFSIFVSGMADNCLLSNQPFLYNNDYSIRVENNKDNYNVVSKLQVLNKKKKTLQLMDNNLIPDDIPTNILCDISVLIRYLEANCYLKFESDIDSFPADLVQSNGKMIFDLVQFLSGKKIPALKQSSKNQSIRKESNQSQIEQLIHNYAQLINFLKAHGALITMRPEYCLSCSEYIKFIQLSSTMSSAPPSSSNNNDGKHKFNALKSSKAQADSQKLKKQSERIHPMISYVCWTQLLFQIIKLFILNKITFEDFIKQCDISELIENHDSFILKYVSNKKLSVKGDEEKDDNDDDDHKLNEDRLTRSNIYTMQENILLLWVSVHYNKLSIHGNQRFFQNFSELCDGIGIAYVLKCYCPHITELEKINIRTPLSEYHKNMNASIIIQSMKKLGLNIAINCDDIIKPIERNICLLILYLYQHLPHYKENNKKNTITFNGNINEDIIRKIHISNPSKVSKICYEIILKGDEQFELKNSSFIVLAPLGKKVNNKNKNKNNNSRLSSAKTNKSVTSQCHLLLEPEADVVISYTPRFIRPATARLTLLAKPFPDALFPCKIPETMTFELKSALIESKPIKTIECKAKLYESTKIEFEVNNPFAQDCEFNIIIKNLIENEESERIPSPWHCDKKSIKIKCKESYNFSMQYLPFTMNNIKKDKCSITFRDNKYGEFLYVVIGESLLPSVIEHIKLKCKDTESISHEINFKNNIKNPLLLKAQKIAANRSQIQSNHKQLVLQSNPCIYDINVSSPFYVAPKQLQLSDKSDENDENDTSLKVTFNPKGPGCYACTITLSSHFIDDKTNNIFNIGDIRIYLIEITACSEGTHAQLEFTAHANETVIQKIPIVNSTPNDWRITREIIGDALHDFNTEKQKEFIVSSDSTNYFNLIYEPTWISQNKSAQLILNNHATNEKYVYDLNCTSFEPLASDHIVLQCQAKSSIEHEFEIENPYINKQQSVEYIIESDLSSKSVQLRGDNSMFIDSKSKFGTYKLSITPQCGGTIHGSISFIEKNNKNKKFIWYAMELNCSSPEPEKIMKISAYLREVVCVEINLSNPLSKIIEFKVAIIGEGLFGKDKLILQAKQNKYIYKLHYSPLITGEVKGSISFSNDISGEFWYSLILIGKKPPSIQLKDMICGVGNVCNQQIKIENPFNEIITLIPNENIIISNTKFYLKNKTKAITINESCITPIILCYRPSLIGIKQECDIILKHKKLGEWNYNVFGLGKEPNIENETIIYAMLHSRISKVISFQNPFDQILKIKIQLESDNRNHDKVFQMFIKKKQKGIISVSPNSSLQIPIFFSPNTMKKYSSNLVICTNNYTKNERELVWNYPIVGLTQYNSSQLLNIKCNAREIFHKIWKLQLDNYHMDNDVDNDDEFKIEIEIDGYAAHTNKIIDKSLQIDLIKKSIKNNNNSLQIEVLFEPLKAFNGTSKLHIINKQGVAWIFQLNFIVNRAHVDDIIRIESQLHCTSSICFVLDFSESIPFRAYFTADSPFEFDVTPKQGNFNQQDGQQFIVSFTPNEYGAALNGTLIIETSVMEWSYKVIGTHPTYIPPNINSYKPTVDTKISKQIQFKRQKEKYMIKNRNFLKKNISATKKQNKL